MAAQAPGPAGMGRIAVASAIGTMCEFYDFNIYGTAAALVFPHIFFPGTGHGGRTAASFATLGVAFVARPFGSILFGHFGDRLGRKKTLIATLLTMGIATLLVGVMPTAAQIGVAAPILVVALRILQGLAAGGEYAGGVLFGAENAPKARRGIWAMFPNLGGGGAIILANITFLLTALFMPEAAFVSWGWRIPFLASIVLVAIGLWIRLKIDETPVFKNEVARAGISKVPFIEAFRSQPRRILLATGTAIGAVYVLTYIGGAYMTSYGTETLKLARTYVLTVAVVGGVAISLGVVAGALLSDRLGRRRSDHRRGRCRGRLVARAVPHPGHQVPARLRPRRPGHHAHRRIRDRPGALLPVGAVRDPLPLYGRRVLLQRGRASSAARSRPTSPPPSSPRPAGSRSA